MEAIPMIVACIAIYFIPTIIASWNEHKHVLPIFLLNALTGWTFFGWVGALLWSVMNNDKKKEV